MGILIPLTKSCLKSLIQQYELATDFEISLRSFLKIFLSRDGCVRCIVLVLDDIFLEVVGEPAAEHISFGFKGFYLDYKVNLLLVCCRYRRHSVKFCNYFRIFTFSRLGFKVYCSSDKLLEGDCFCPCFYWLASFNSMLLVLTGRIAMYLYRCSRRLQTNFIATIII